MAERYVYGLNSFHEFCDAQHIRLGQRLPASEEVLCAFAASQAGEIAGGTVGGALAAIKAWHIVEGAPWLGGIWLRYTLKGVENLAPESSKRDLRPPVTRLMISILARDLDLSNTKDACVFAAACCAFWGQIRLGEILSDAQSKYKRGRIPLVADVGNPTTAAGSRALKLPYTKTKRARGDTTFLCRQNSHKLPDNVPLFSYKNEQGSLICLSKKKFLGRCNEIWVRCGIPTFTGHSFRIGRTTELLLAGVAPEIVQAMGRWLSDAFMVYWCRLDFLALLYAEFLAV
ncbi:hypothetical protein C8R45DRAFT_1056767 [Mycena sanguinolenta]|nr:hypothetical protein C8R45DRAFT_1056767 [Mycena sanguinolenta]